MLSDPASSGPFGFRFSRDARLRGMMAATRYAGTRARREADGEGVRRSLSNHQKQARSCNSPRSTPFRYLLVNPDTPIGTGTQAITGFDDGLENFSPFRSASGKGFDRRLLGLMFMQASRSRLKPMSMVEAGTRVTGSLRGEREMYWPGNVGQKAGCGTTVNKNALISKKLAGAMTDGVTAKPMFATVPYCPKILIMNR